MKRQTKAEKALDLQIDRIYNTHCCGVQLSVLDIPKVFRAGYVAAAAGQDVQAAVLAAVAQLRKN